jgi:hypothetical protein
MGQELGVQEEKVDMEEEEEEELLLGDREDRAIMILKMAEEMDSQVVQLVEEMELVQISALVV